MNRLCGRWTALLMVLAAGILAAGESNAEPWEFGMVLDVGAIRSDNILLSADGQEQSDTVFRISPQIGLTKESDRVNATINYIPEALFYQDTENADEVYHVLDARMETALIEEQLFVELSAVNFQLISGSETQFTTNNIPISGQRTDTTILSVAPRFQQQLGNAGLRAGATYRKTQFDDPNTLDSDEKSATLRLDNYSEQQGLAWALDYQYTRFDFSENGLPWEYQRAGAELGFWVGGNLRIFASGGVETPYDEFFEPAMDDDYWEGGFAYTPNDRLEMEFAAGERGFGTSVRGRIALESRRGATELSYDETPSTQNSALAGRRPIEQQDNLDDFLVRLNNNQFIRKRLQWITTMQLARTRLMFRLFNEDREETFALDGVRLPDESVRGAALRLDWDIGARTTVGLTGDFADRDGGISEEDLKRYGIEATYRMTRRFSLISRLLRAEESSVGANFSGYTENQIQLFLRSTF